MTKKQYYKKVDELIRKSSAQMKDIARKLALSNCIDFDAYEDNYELPKQAMYAIHNEMKWQFKPLTKEGQKIAENMTLFT